MSSEALKTAIRSLVPRAVRNSLRSPAKALNWLSQSVQFGLGVTKQMRVSEDLILRCHPLAFQSAQRAQIGDPEQSAEFRQFVTYCGPEMFLFDIGASFGIFSLACAGLGGKALAVDPSHTAAKMISRHIKIKRIW